MELLRSKYLGSIHSGSGTLILRDDPQANVFAVVTRIQNPSGEGAVTMICSDYTQCLGQVARTLTDDARLGELLSQLQWPPNELARHSFQWLFAIRLRETETTKPVLIAARPERFQGASRFLPAGAAKAV